MDNCLILVNPEVMKTSMRTANFAREAMVKKSMTLSGLQDQIKNHMKKKLRISSK